MSFTSHQREHFTTILDCNQMKRNNVNNYNLNHYVKTPAIVFSGNILKMHFLIFFLHKTVT